jgi:YtkA-like protein
MGQMRLLLVVISAATMALPAAAGAGAGIVGPGEGHTVVSKLGYRVEITIAPNIGGLVASDYTLVLTRSGKPVTGTVAARFSMIAMGMPALDLRFRQVSPGRYSASGTKLTMPGRWQIDFHIAPRRARTFDVVIVDRAVTQ